MEYNLHQDELWYKLGETIAAYSNELTKVSTNPSSYLLIPTRIPYNSQKVKYRDRLVEGLNAKLDGECGYQHYQISNWAAFTWRYKLQINPGEGEARTAFLYGDNVGRRLLYSDVPREAITMIEEVCMNEVFFLPVEGLDEDHYIDCFAEVLMEPLAAKTITIDHVHRYADNRLRFDLIFDDMRYHLVCAVRQLDGLGNFPEFTVFVGD